LQIINLHQPSELELKLEEMLEHHPKKMDLTLGRIKRLLKILGNPEKNLPPIIHVAGTNGKGSVVAITRAILEAGGYRVHVLTSPHLVRFNERIRLAGTLIEDDYLIKLIKVCEKANRDENITYFEMVTAIAFLAFNNNPADVCILEVGLGGLLDATNVIENPMITAITSIGIDHQNFLGEKIEDIAKEKAGIIKKEIPLVLAEQSAEVYDVISEKATLNDAPLLKFGENWTTRLLLGNNIKLLYEDKMGKLLLPTPSLVGAHQVANAGQAIAILRHQEKLSINEASIKTGLECVKWPARLQLLGDCKMASILPKGSIVLLDGGHNPSAAIKLKAFCAGLNHPKETFYLIAGMMEGKDLEGFLKPFSSLAKACYSVSIKGQNASVSPSKLAVIASEVGLPGRIAKDVPSAIKAISAESHEGRPPVILITGSLYLAGEVLKEIGEFPT
jgi:dihydrofolate synthase/folylpolyglutamate synthase